MLTESFESMRPPAVPLIKMNSPQNVSSDPSISVAAKLLSNHRLHPLFLSRYHMTSELGAGGFGFVLGGAEITSNKPVAVKFIIKSRVLPSNWVHDDQVGAIPLEVYLLRHCAHKNVIAFLDLYVDEKFVYLVTELHGSQWHSAKNTLDLTACADHSPQDSSYSSMVPAEDERITANYMDQMEPPELKRSQTCPLPVKLIRRPSMDLFECIEQFEHIPEDTAKQIFRQIAEAVRYLHARGIVHRDIKDENIVVDSAFHVKLIDFGSAALVSPGATCMFDRFQGTIQYASPEILRGEKYHGRSSDIWALGVLLYTILFGEVPFASSEQAKHSNFKQPRVPSSNDCMHLLSWMLQKQALRRPTADEILRHSWFQK